MKKRLLGNTLKFTILFIGLSVSSFAQENPWSKAQSNYNPWTQELEQEEKKPLVTSQKTVDTVGVEIKPSLLKEETIATVQEGSFTLKHRNGITQTYQRSEVNTDRVLQEYGKEKYRAPGGAILSGLGSFIAPGFSVPFTMLSPLSTTKQTQSILFDFERNNPDATEADFKSIKKGMRKKRYKHAAIGTILGTIGGLILWNL